MDLGNSGLAGDDYSDMDCSAYREAISARIDGEDAALEAAAVDAHVAGCSACRSWAEVATAVTRSARVGLAEPVPDLTAQIMAALAPRPRLKRGPRDAPAARPGSPRRGRRRTPSEGPGAAYGLRRRPSPAGAPVAASSRAGVARLGLALVAAAQLCLAVPALLGNDAGASIHVAHEQGSWALALAVGLLVVAIRPARAAAILPVVAVLAAALALTTALDIAAGRAQAAGEAPHGLAFLGLGMLSLLARDVHRRRGRAMTRPA